jgi:hypothetical protein
MDRSACTRFTFSRAVSGWSVAATSEGEFSGVTTGYAGKGAVRYAW